MEVITEKTKRKHMPYCDHGRENLCFDLFKLNRRFEHITHKKAVVVEISVLRIIQCRKGRGGYGVERFVYGRVSSHVGEHWLDAGDFRF